MAGFKLSSSTTVPALAHILMGASMFQVVTVLSETGQLAQNKLLGMSTSTIGLVAGATMMAYGVGQFLGRWN